MTTELRAVTFGTRYTLIILLLDNGMKGLENKFRVRVGLSCASKYITEEPDAVVPHVRICVGAVR